MRNHWPNREHWERGDRFNSSGVGGYFLGGKSPLIKSIQRGTISLASVTSNTATITAVDTSNFRVKLLGMFTNNAGLDFGSNFARVSLTNSTTVTATLVSNSGVTVVVAYEVIEFAVGYIKSVQQGTVTIAGSSQTGTATVTSVVTTLAELSNSGYGMSASENFNNMLCHEVLTNATTVTGSRGSATGTSTITMGFDLVEYNP